MADGTGISWTDATWNPVRGCSRVSAGCRHCYAEAIAARFSKPGQPYEGLAKIGVHTGHRPKWTGEVRFVAEHLADPLRWKKPRRIFVNSMSDLFHEKLTNEQIAAVFGVMAAAPRHTFQILTKRAERMREWFEWFHQEVLDQIDSDETMASARMFVLSIAVAHALDDDGLEEDYQIEIEKAHGAMPWPLPNVWLGVSVENHDVMLERVTALINTPAALRFLSCEPLIGPLDLGPAALALLGWVIAGCESGRGARPCDVAWLRSLRDQCAAANVPFFLKQAKCELDTRERTNGIGGRSLEGPPFAVRGGPGSKKKGGGIFELPYLDGKQHAEFP